MNATIYCNVVATYFFQRTLLNKSYCYLSFVPFCYLLIVTEEKLQLAEEHIESLEQQLAESEKKVTEAAMKGFYFRVLLIVCEFCVLFCFFFKHERKVL